MPKPRRTMCSSGMNHHAEKFVLTAALVRLSARPETFPLSPAADITPTKLEVLLHQNTPLKRGAGPPEQPAGQYPVGQDGGAEPLTGGNSRI